MNAKFYIIYKLLINTIWIVFIWVIVNNNENYTKIVLEIMETNSPQILLWKLLLRVTNLFRRLDGNRSLSSNSPLALVYWYKCALTINIFYDSRSLIMKPLLISMEIRYFSGIHNYYSVLREQCIFSEYSLR